MLLVESHGLFRDLLFPIRSALVLLLDRLDLGLDRLHRLHGADLLDSKRQQDDSHQQGQQDDGHAVIRDELVEVGQGGAQEVTTVNALRHGECPPDCRRLRVSRR